MSARDVIRSALPATKRSCIGGPTWEEWADGILAALSPDGGPVLIADGTVIAVERVGWMVSQKAPISIQGWLHHVHTDKRDVPVYAPKAEGKEPPSSDTEPRQSAATPASPELTETGAASAGAPTLEGPS